MNQQLPEKRSWNEDGSLEVHSVFFTIQGEGPYVGNRAVFVRLAGCNLQCPECDTTYADKRALVKPEALLEAVKECIQSALGREDDAVLVVITGGEPYRQNLKPFTDLLRHSGMLVQIETNGTLFQQLQYDSVVVVCSPKTGSINPHLVPHIDALKYVIHADHVDEDGLPVNALGHSAMPRLARPPEEFMGAVYLQPIDEGDAIKNERHLQAAVESVKRFGYILCLQVHKIIGTE
jgi:7-carboxy-7-deazaguanine synthase